LDSVRCQGRRRALEAYILAGAAETCLRLVEDEEHAALAHICLSFLK